MLMKNPKVYLKLKEKLTIKKNIQHNVNVIKKLFSIILEIFCLCNFFNERLDL